jgi:hypothetical protein
VYIKAGASESGDFLLEFASAAGTLAGETALRGMTETPGASESYVYQTGYDLIVPAAGAILAGAAEGGMLFGQIGLNYGPAFAHGTITGLTTA